jgi:hypothetical protein
MRKDAKSLLSLSFPAARSGPVWKDAPFGTWAPQASLWERTSGTALGDREQKLRALGLADVQVDQFAAWGEP